MGTLPRILLLQLISAGRIVPSRPNPWNLIQQVKYEIGTEDFQQVANGCIHSH
jgi:hypothetical protein